MGTTTATDLYAVRSTESGPLGITWEKNAPAGWLYLFLFIVNVM